MARRGVREKLSGEVARVLRMHASSGDALVVACSHGPDSLALAHAVLSLRRMLKLGAVTLIYVDHALRPEAALEAERVVRFATDHGCGHRTVRIRVPEAASWEAAARDARYAALEQARQELGARFILTGHTASDQAETLLERLIRGAGVLGLAGIPRARGAILRPLLAVSRDEVLSYLDACALAPSIDASNEDLRFFRNRVRHQLLPALRIENPRIDRALNQTAAALREASDVLEWAVGQFIHTVVRSRTSNQVVLDAGSLAVLPPGLAKRMLQEIAIQLGAELGAKHLQAVLDSVKRKSTGTQAISVPRIDIRHIGNDLVFSQRTEPSRSASNLVVEGNEDGNDGPYLIRNWRPGDRMRPQRLNGKSQKLADLWTHQKIARDFRRTAQVVVRERDGEIVWAQHVGAAFGVNLRVTLTKEDPAANNVSRSEKGP